MTDEFSLDQLIRDFLSRSREPDPHVLARRLVAKIPQEQRDAVLATCLHDRVRVAITRQRMTQTTAEPSPGQSRWKRNAPALHARYCVAGEWKLLKDCTAEDCDTLAGEYARRAAEQAAIADRFQRLAQRLRDAGAGTVGDLGDDHLEAAA